MGFSRVVMIALTSMALAETAAAETRNLIIFVADGLRSGSVTPETAPVLAEVRDKGVDFHNSHSMFPTLTTVNAASIAPATGPAIPETSATCCGSARASIRPTPRPSRPWRTTSSWA